MSKSLETIKWLSAEEMEKLSNDREPTEAPICNQYQIQPENQGKLVWLSGPPGTGKSTTGELMGKQAGFVYFEADCTMYGLNPFLPLESKNPAAVFQQKALKVIM